MTSDIDRGPVELVKVCVGARAGERGGRGRSADVHVQRRPFGDSLAEPYWVPLERFAEMVTRWVR